jgi:predicted secreted hydrolase
MNRLLRLAAAPKLELPLPWMPRAQPAPIARVHLPFDEQPHARLMEWWHFMGRVYDKPQDAGVEPKRALTFVLSILKAQVAGLANLVGLVILIDHEQRTYNVNTNLGPIGSCYSEPTDGRRFRFHFGPPGPVRAGSSPAWDVVGGMGSYAIAINTSEQISLVLQQRTPAALLGKERDGVMRYLDEDQMAYYAWPNMDVISGSRGTGAERTVLEGRGWMEHQWGDMPLGDYRWRYVAVDVVLDDKSRIGQLLLFRAEKSASTVRYAVWVSPSGRCSVLDHPDLAVKDLNCGTWRGVCPIGTQITFRVAADDGADISGTLDVTPVFREQECTTELSPAFFPRFWEGACTVRGSVETGGKKIAVDAKQSWAITELAGYP